MGLGCPLPLSYGRSERINSDLKGLATVFPEVNTSQRVCLALETKNFYNLSYLAIKNEGGYSSHVTVPDSASIRTDPGLQGRLESWSSPSLLGWGIFFLLTSGLFIHQKFK